MSDQPLFAFEVPTSRGIVRVVGPADLDQEEADAVAFKVARILRTIILPPELVPQFVVGDDEG